MRFLITGGAGFIGSHLSERLILQGHRVTVLDDLSTGSLDNLAALEGHPCFEFVQGSVLSKSLVRRLVAASDRVIHLAGDGSVSDGAPAAMFATSARAN